MISNTKDINMNGIISLLNDSNWGDALYVHERSLHEGGNIDSHDVTEWRYKAGLQDEVVFNERLESDSLNLESFQRIITYKGDILSEEYKDSEWFMTLEKVFLNDKISTDLVDALNLIDESSVPFIEFMIPFLQFSLNELLEKLEEGNIELNPRIKRNLILAVLKANIQILLQLSGKTLVFELNKSRIMKDLVGETSKDRYFNFIEKKFNSNKNILEFLMDYPVLGRLMCEKVKNTTLYIVDSIIDFHNDHQELNERLGIKTDEIQTIEMHGDSHNKGKNILIYHFENKQKLIYKPHSVSVDIAFQKLLNWFNSKNIDKKFKTVNIINQERYGWVEFIEHHECTSLDEVHNFYERQGQNLALLYILNATDIHYENIIASGENPIIIDLEALFHNNTIFRDTKTATSKALSDLNNSVIRTSLLPISIRNVNDIKLDISGLGSQENQVMYAYKFVNLWTDEMKMEKSIIPVDKKNNHPHFNGEKFNNTELFTEDIIKGFKNTYEIILKHLTKFVEPNGLLDMFKSTLIRDIVRDTQTYSTILEAGRHPKYLKSGLDRVKLFDNMWRAAENFSIFSKVIDSEIKDLLNDDIPYFWSRPESSNMYDPRGNTIQNFYNQDSFSRVRDNFNNFSFEDLQKQVEHIDYALTTVKKVYEITANSDDLSITPEVDFNALNFFSKDDYLDEAIRIGELLLEDAIWGEDKKSITWISLGINEYEQVEYKPMELGLYDGLVGMAIFYAYLGEETKNFKYKEVAKCCLNSVLEEYSDIGQRKVGTSAFLGYGSIIYAINHFYYLWKEDELLKIGKGIIDGIITQVNNDKMYDFLGGSAGIIQVALDFYKISNYSESLKLAQVCGDHLISNSVNMPNGLGWIQINRTMGKPLGGLAHGSSGIAFALFKLNDFTGEERYKETAMKAIEYDNSLLNKSEQNWVDLRNTENSGEVQFPTYWCNGAPGVGLSRLYSLDYTDIQELNSDLELSINKTVADGFNKTSHSLCHGDFGNLDFLLSAAIKKSDYKLLDEVYARANMILKEMKTTNLAWNCGIPGSDKPTPNLFTGLAGIGYTMLRLNNVNLPAVLILESPELSIEEKEKWNTL